MWSDTVGLIGQDRSETKKIDVVKHGVVTLVVIMILKDTATFQVLFIVSLVYSVLGTSLL